jgi:hypothetical protein
MTIPFNFPQAHNTVMIPHNHWERIVKTKSLRHIILVLGFPLLAIWHALELLNKLQNRERARLHAEFSQTRGLMQLLMKQRNGYHWTFEDRRMIRMQLKTILGLSPYVVLLVAPGGLVALPFLAWWLDRRRKQRAEVVIVK